LVSGLLLAAPYAAIMSTVAAFLLMISSSLVRDLYQRTINPDVSPRTMKVISYGVTALVGVVVMLGALNPPGFLQYIIVFTGTGQGCSFLVPMFLGLYWRRATRAGVIAAMLGGFLVVLGLYALGWIDSRCQAAIAEYERKVETAQARNEPAPEPPALARALDDGLRWFPGWGEKRPDRFAPLYAGGLDPLVWGFLASLALGVGVSLMTKPDPELVKKYFF
jgi:Na+/proline symporter